MLALEASVVILTRYDGRPTGLAFSRALPLCFLLGTDWGAVSNDSTRSSPLLLSRPCLPEYGGRVAVPIEHMPTATRIE